MKKGKIILGELVLLKTVYVKITSGFQNSSDLTQSSLNAKKKENYVNVKDVNKSIFSEV